MDLLHSPLHDRHVALGAKLAEFGGWDMARIPNRDLREGQAISAFFFAAAINRESIGAMFATHPPLQVRLDQLAKVSAELSEQG